jgi:hypothetical protein
LVDTRRAVGSGALAPTDGIAGGVAVEVQSFVWIGFVAFFVASLACGIRLVALWWKNRELPELLIGLGVLGIGPVGFGFVTIGQLLGADHGALARVVSGLGVFATSGGVFAKFVFNYKVYHPNRGEVKALVAVVGAVLLAGFLGQWAGDGFATLTAVDATYLTRSALQIACLLWGAFEALRYWRLMERRQRIGLADPLVTNRFLLWGIGAGAAGVGTAVGVTAQLWTGRPPLEIPAAMLSSSLHGLVAAFAMWFAFLPAERYRRWIEARAAHRSAD